MKEHPAEPPVWNQKDRLELTNGAMVRNVDKRIRELAALWCDKNLKSVPKNELHAALNMNIGIMAWYRFCRECNIPLPTDDVRKHFNETAWDAFREQCLEWYAGFKK